MCECKYVRPFLLQCEYLIINSYIPSVCLSLYLFAATMKVSDTFFLIFNSFAIQTKQFLCYKKVPFYEIDLFVIVVYLDGLETGERKINPVIAGTNNIRSEIDFLKFAPPDRSAVVCSYSLFQTLT